MTKRFLIKVTFIAFLLIAVGGGMMLAQGVTSTSTTKHITLTSGTTEILVCVKSAVDKRETAIQTAFATFSDSMNSAFQTRKSALLSAWGITNKTERQTAIINAWNAFKKARINATGIFRKAKDVAWKQFTIDRKACKATPTGENSGDELSF